MLDAAPSVIRRYFEFDAQRDIDSLVELFTADATVVDDGVSRHGTAEIGAWQSGQASEYTYTKTVLGSESVAADRYLVTARLEGNFPGGTADLRYEFSIEGDRISHLIIAPLAS